MARRAAIGRAELAQIVERAIGPGCKFESRALPAGTGARAKLVVHSGGRFVLKLPDRHAEHVLPPGEHYELLQIVARHGLGPVPLAFDAESGAILVEYCAQAEPWAAADARRSRNIDRAARLLSELHRLRAKLRPFDAHRFVESYVAGIDSIGSRRDSALAVELRGLVAELPGPGVACVCHNDLCAANILDDGRLWLIDFEYAASAPAIVDLASLAASNDFSLAQQRRLLDAYEPLAAAGTNFATFAKFVRIHKLIAHFWRLQRRVRGAPQRNVR